MLFFNTLDIVTKVFLICTSAGKIYSNANINSGANNLTIRATSNSGQESAPPPMIYSPNYGQLSLFSSGTFVNVIS